VILPIYSAGEKKIEGVDSVSLCEGIASHGHKEVVYIEGHESAVTYLNRTLRKNDILLTQGAGDVWKVGMAVLDSIMKQKKRNAKK
jgi:UDP-N-acetylmuramate--alanine ligase